MTSCGKTLLEGRSPRWKRALVVSTIGGLLLACTDDDSSAVDTATTSSGLGGGGGSVVATGTSAISQGHGGSGGGAPACEAGEERICGDDAVCVAVTQRCEDGIWGACTFTGDPAREGPCNTDCDGGTLDGSSLFCPVNRIDGIEAGYEPDDLVTVPAAYRVGFRQMRLQALGHFIQLADAVEAATGIGLYCASGHRSFDTQCDLFASYAAEDGCETANTYSARAGHSEHQLGTVCDFSSSDGTFLDGESAVDDHLAEHAHEYGFVMSYPAGTMTMTGYIHEPWHFRYVGREAAARHHELSLAWGRPISNHELSALAICAWPNEASDWEVEAPADATAAGDTVCARFGDVSTCQSDVTLLRCGQGEAAVVTCPTRCNGMPSGVHDTCS